MKRNVLRITAALGAAAFLFTTGFARAEDHASGKAGYLRSATYYSDDWVINFWNSESSRMDEELAQIAEDGFNNIILVVPWREFQPDTSPCTYNSYAWDKLDRVMEAAADQGLSVMLRVGYTWDYYGRDNVLSRYRGLMYDGEVRDAWMEYVGRLYERASSHGNFCGGFITWEDFWNFTDTSASLGNKASGKKMARQCGYTEYAREHYTLEELEDIYGHSLESYDDLYFPEKDSYARKIFFEFYDDFLNGLLAESQEAFPGLSMEVRLDVDPVEHGDGSLEGFMHSSTFPCGDAAYTSTMYSVPMGFLNEHERVTAEEVLEKLPVFMNRLHVYSGGKPVYIDQFLFTDNTVGYEHNAQLMDDQKALFLEKAAPVLKSMTMGYGIWTYRDYGDNKLYNAQFGLGQEGWRFSGGSSVVTRDSTRQAMIPGGAGIYQDIGNRMTGTTGKDTHVRFLAESEGSSQLSVSASGRTRTLEVKGARTVELVFENCSAKDFSISVSGSTAYVDDVHVFTFTTQGELYQMDGSEGSCIEALRLMNQNL
ncbi:hypothetical protein LK537_22160 [Lachnoclostridium pacaense]|uniref:hypothetical protein n=1 Tax=Enterocloster hominis (ex Hitch et al. 2024) TaxID=1917870 RepID=UPI001D0F719E|nr:hypothetical protein [Lachnoclostridium pacaense]MCC2820009.1 hypothetical protein [Lachnoclostridium pacaense]